MTSTPVVDFSNTEVAFASRSDRELREMHRLFSLMNNHHLVAIGSWLAVRAVRWNLPFTEYFIRKTLFEQFCGGTSIFECQPKIDKLFQNDILTILDFGAEAKSSEADFDRTLEEQTKSIDFAAANASVPVISTKLTGLGRYRLFEKLQKGSSLTPEEKAEFDRMKDRLNTLCAHASDREIGIMVDAEETWVQDVIDELVREMMSVYNREHVTVYNTYQLYRKDKLSGLQSDFEKAKRSGYLLGAKLVRGAYMNRERIRAREMGYPSPIQESKEATDRDYNKALEFCVDNYEYIGSCNATHNAYSCQLQATLIANKDIPNNHPRLNFCQLYGMSDFLTFNLVDQGFNVAKYMPYGPIKDVVPYLVRRAHENTSVTGEMSRELSFIKQELNRRTI